MKLSEKKNMKPKYIENKNNKFKIGDKVTYIDLNGINRKANIINIDKNQKI